MLTQNVNYSSAKAAKYLRIPELIWALQILGKTRRCVPDIISAFYEYFETQKGSKNLYSKRSTYFFKNMKKKLNFLPL